MGDGGWVRLFGNDDPRPVSAHVDELHPSSRLRGIIAHDHKVDLRCNCSRDTLRSLIASQRHMAHVCKGDVTLDELRRELERDCVTIDPPGRAVLCAQEKRVWHMAGQLACAWNRWPLMRYSFHAAMRGKRTEWDAGPLHCYVQMAKKPQAQRANRRPLFEFTSMVVHGVCAALDVPKRLDALRQRLAVVDIEKAVFALSTPEHGCFWWMLHDDGSHHHRHFDEIVTDAHVDWNDTFFRAIQRCHDRIPDVNAVFGTGRAFDILCHAMREHGYAVQRADNHVAEHRVPLVLPTMWKLGCGGRHNHILISVVGNDASGA